jgi:hypothetical protein
MHRRFPTVARFIGEGWSSTSRDLVATPSTRAAVLEQLVAMAVDPQSRINKAIS